MSEQYSGECDSSCVEASSYTCEDPDFYLSDHYVFDSRVPFSPSCSIEAVFNVREHDDMIISLSRKAAISKLLKLLSFGKYFFAVLGLSIDYINTDCD